MPEFRKYDCLLIDVVNLCYKTFTKKNDLAVQVGSKLVYKNSICNFIKSIEDLVKKYLHSDGQVYLLFDNYFSRADLRSSFMFADRRNLDEAYKETRKKENREFYNSINFIKYYYLLGLPNYHTLQIQGLEADDLVKPLLEDACLDKTCLFLTSDLDWCRYLREDPRIDWLPKLNEEPQTIKDLEYKLGFEISEKNIILYKTIFGDASDNIESIVPLNESNKNEFLTLLKETSYPDEFIYLSRDASKVANSKILKAISQDERRFYINMQLVSSLPCSKDAIHKNLTSGRQAETLLKTVKLAMGLDESSKFVFGNIKRPRV